MLRISNNIYFNSIAATTGIEKSILEKSILEKFKLQGPLKSNYLEREIQEYVKYLFRVYTDFILMANDLADFYECFTNIIIYESKRTE